MFPLIDNDYFCFRSPNAVFTSSDPAEPTSDTTASVCCHWTSSTRRSTSSSGSGSSSWPPSPASSSSTASPSSLGPGSEWRWFRSVQFYWEKTRSKVSVDAIKSKPYQRLKFIFCAPFYCIMHIAQLFWVLEHLFVYCFKLGPHWSCWQRQNSRPSLRTGAELLPAAWRVLHPLSCGQKYGWGEV